jgi:SAM-dependent methyltransferase
MFENQGYCYCCDANVTFSSKNDWFRDSYQCSNCGCVPRERALMLAIDKFFPQWRELEFHESSPIGRGASNRIQKEAKKYIPSQYYPGVPSGKTHLGNRCEDLEALSFADNSVDIHITQDVFEHLFNPVAAFREIARTLRPGGAHIFTVPIVNKQKPTRQCASIDAKGKVKHLVEKPEYHGNPVDTEGSLVTWNWGYDITECIDQACGLHTQIVWMDALEFGIRAEYIEVLITRKPKLRLEDSAYYPMVKKYLHAPTREEAVSTTDRILRAVESACESNNPRVAFASMLTLADLLIENGHSPFARILLGGALHVAAPWDDPEAVQQIKNLEKRLK